MANEIKLLVTNSSNPCSTKTNTLLHNNIPCNIGVGCNKCIWDKYSDINSRLLEIVDLLEVDDVS